MIFKNIHKILWMTIVSLFTYTYAITGVTRMKALVIYTQYPVSSVTNALKSYGIDYTEWNASKFNAQDTLTPHLYDNGKRPLYYMIIVDGNLEAYNETEQAWKSLLTYEQWKELDDYETEHHVRRVIVNNFPKPKVDGDTISYEENQTTPQYIVSAHNDYALKIFNDARVRTSAPLNTNGLTHAYIEDPNDEEVTPILYFKPMNESKVKEKILAAAILNMGNDREIFSFFLEFSQESITSTILNHLWITWASRNLIGGHRRIFFSPQIENIFLSTRIVDEALEKKGFNITNFEDALVKKFRASPVDFASLIEFVKSLKKSGEFNKGSQFQIELAFNGKGILHSQDVNSLKRRMGASLYSHEPQDHTHPHQGHKLHETDDAEKSKSDSSTGQPVAVISGNILKASEPESKTEKEIWVEEVTKYWSMRHETYTNDELFNFFSDLNVRKEFNWFSNTYSNKVMIDVSKNEVKDQILKNVEIAMHLGLVSKDLSNSELWWSKGSIGTRGSLGYTDDLVQEIMTQYNIHYGFGNQHREDIVNLENPYLPWKNEDNSFFVIPRDKRLTFRWASSPLQAIWLYKKFYNDKFTKDQTASDDDKTNDSLYNDWHKVLELESDDAVQSLLNLRHDPFVFNQANVRIHSNAANENNSILAQWLRATIKKFNSYVLWPMTSIKSDFLAKYYADRAIQSECGVDFSYSYNDTHILAIQATSLKACRVPITVTGDVTEDARDKSLSFEKIGYDPLTVWIDLPGDSVTKLVELNPPLSFNDRTIIPLDGINDFNDGKGSKGEDDDDEPNPFMVKIKAVQAKPEHKKVKTVNKLKIITVIKDKDGNTIELPTTADEITETQKEHLDPNSQKMVIKKVKKIKKVTNLNEMHHKNTEIKNKMEKILSGRDVDEEYANIEEHPDVEDKRSNK